MKPRVFVRRPAKADVASAFDWRFPYAVYFVVLSRHISVIAVLHGHRNPQVWQRRR